MSTKKEFIPIHDPKLVEQLKHKQSGIDALLSFTKAMAQNKTTLELFRIYVSTLIEKFNYSNIFFLYKTATGWFVLQNDKHQHLENINLLEFLSPFKELTYLNQDEAVLGEYDTIIPVLHKDKAIAYVMIEGVHNKVIDSVEAEVRFLETYTNVVVMAAENQRLLKNEIQQAYEKKELEMAAEIQHALIPSTFPEIKGVDFAAEYIPHYEIGGDGFDIMVNQEKDDIFITMADVSGKGVSAALLMANFQASLRSAVALEKNHIGFANRINHQVHKITKGERFISLFIAHINTTKKVIHYMNFGHNPPFILEGNEVHTLDIGSTIIGVFDNLPFTNLGRIKYKDDITLFTYTDGLTDVFNEDNQRFEMERLRMFLTSKKFTSPEDLNKSLLKLIDQYKGPKGFSDDITFLTTMIRK